jgi:hypothetical protein
VWNASGVEVPFYRGRERVSVCSKGGGMTRVIAAAWAKWARRPGGPGGGGRFCWVRFHSRETTSLEGVRSPEWARLAKWSRPREWAMGLGGLARLGRPRRRWGGGLARGNGIGRLGQK